MLRLLTLGQVELEGDPSEEPDAVLRGPKRLGLLAYLAAATPRGFHRRDALVALLWPESDQARARHNLRNTLYVLRKALGAGVIRTRGSDEIGLSEETLWCDVVAFDQALGSGRTDQALKLYRGEFLEHFHLPDTTPEFERWVEERRDGLARAYARALEQSAEDAADAGELDVATDRWRRLLDLDPYSDRVVIRLMETLEAAGDRVAAIRRAREHGELLREELDLEPNPEVEALAERMQTKSARGPTVDAESDFATAEVDGDGPRGAPTSAPGPGPLTASFPLVGRQAEWDRLQAAWRFAASGRSHFALIAGEAGIGKTRLAEELLAWTIREGAVTAGARSYAAEGRLPFAPVVEWLRSDALRPGLERLTPVWLAEISRLLPELRSRRPDLSPQPLKEDWNRQRFFEALVRALLATGEPQLLLLDDLQWCDTETLKWLHFLMRFDPQAPLLVLGTARMDEVLPDHPLCSLVSALDAHEQLTRIPLESLDLQETTELASKVANRALEAEVVAGLHRETEGNPLFLVEIVRARLLEEEPVPAGDGSRESTPAPSPPEEEEFLPPRVQTVIRSRLAQLSPTARELAAVAATIGREFSAHVLSRACDTDNETLAAGLDELWQRRIVREHGADAYDFSHDKLREVAYSELGPARRRLLHRRVAEALEALHAPDLDAVSGRLAFHYDRAEMSERAVSLYHRAGEAAQSLYANEEAVLHFRRAIELLESSPAGPERKERELALHVSLGDSLIAARGWAAPEVGMVYSHASDLCEEVGEAAKLGHVLWGLQAFHMVRSELSVAHGLGEHLLRLAREQDDPRLLVAAHFVLGFSLFNLGDFVPAAEHLERAIAVHDLEGSRLEDLPFGSELRVLCFSAASHASWFLGYSDRAFERSHEALSLTEELDQPFSRTVALDYAAMLHQFRQEFPEVEERTAEAIDLCREYGFPYYGAWGRIMKGWALAMQGKSERGMEEMRRGMAALRETGAELRRPYYLSLMAEVCGGNGRADEGVARVREAIDLAEKSGEQWWTADLHRLEGELLLANPGDERRAESAFRRSLEVAKIRNAGMPRLTSTVSLSRLLRQRGETEEARRILREIHGAFDEGFDTPELKEAGALLAELGGPS